MPEFRYKAVDNAGRVTRGSVTGLDEADIETRLAQSGLILVQSRRTRKPPLFSILAGSRVKPRVMIEFYHRLSQTLELGLPIISSLEENAKLLPSAALRRIIGETVVALEGGNTLYESLRRFPKTFEKLDLAIVMMGEQAGILPKSLKELATFLEWKEDIRSTIKRAAVYPAFIFTTVLGVVGVWVGYVLPQLAEVLSEMGVALPTATKTLLQISIFTQENWAALLGAAVIAVVLSILFMKTKRGAYLVHKYWIRAPLLGPVALNIAVARLSRNFAAMYSAGMNLNSIFEILTDNVLGNRYLEAQLQKVYQEVQSGGSLTEGFEATGGFPPLLIGGIRNGESTGTLDASMVRLGDYYDGEVKRTVQAMVNAIEPISTLLLGGVFGLIALSILLPLYDVIGQLK